MSLLEDTPATAVIATETTSDEGSYVDWPAIIAGAVMASAISVVLLTFGSALGLTLASPFDNAGWSAAGLAIALALWLVWVQVSSFFAGGYVAGRLRRRNYDATEHESDVRDALHGFAVWGTGVVIGAVLLALGATGILGTTAAATGQAAGSALSAMVDENANPLDYVVGTAFRSDQPIADDRAAASADAAAILGRDLTGDEAGVSDADRAYLSSLIARQTGLSQEEADQRADQMISNAQQAVDKAKSAAERARKIGIIAAFVAAASLAISAAGAAWAAGLGGRHRDEATILPFFDRLR